MTSRILLFVVLAVGVFTLVSAGHAAGVTQGEYAVALAKQLNQCGDTPLCDGSEMEVCIEALESLGIVPPGGWVPDKILTDEDLADITYDAIRASNDGKIGCTPQRAVDLVAAAAGSLGLGTKVVFDTAYTAIGYYVPPQSPAVSGSGGGIVSISK